MNSQQTDKFQMFGTLRHAFAANQPAWSATPALARQITALDGVIATISALRESQEADRRGVAVDKYQNARKIVTRSGSGRTTESDAAPLVLAPVFPAAPSPSLSRVSGGV